MDPCSGDEVTSWFLAYWVWERSLGSVTQLLLYSCSVTQLLLIFYLLLLTHLLTFFTKPTVIINTHFSTINQHHKVNTHVHSPLNKQLKCWTTRITWNPSAYSTWVLSPTVMLKRQCGVCVDGGWLRQPHLAQDRLIWFWGWVRGTPVAH